MEQVSAPALAAWLADPNRAKPLLLDVREPWEFDTCHIPGSVLMTMHTVPMRWQELDEDAEIVCICHHGGRSMQVAAYLARQGFAKVINLTGGVHAWAQQVDSTMPTY
ncbi:rhodanese-like domain-containing protein [Massilia sp. TS11]|uniref:rhodanese-like domain-containing protein n=1 Tax=Massilia sp. TS11 TaxID=2908003 RepID=UPI001EDB2300|nr:rhodanese-like domain-containing protein [Massilia sp. TS11]MCG2586338.1 sulfurtransferase [Massilia sp. TS11]